MTLIRRKPSVANGIERSTLNGDVDENEKNGQPCDTKPKLYNSDQVPNWYAHNAFILTGYRPVTKSVHLCTQSLTYMHNETANIYSHFIPAILALVSNYFLRGHFASHFPLAPWTDRLVLHIHLTTSILCFGTSAAYHTLLCHSEYYMSLWTRLDFLAIIIQIIGSFIPGIYFGFYCEPGLQRLHWTMIISLGTLTGIIVMNPRFQGPRWKTLRLLTFVATGLSGFAPIIHAVSIFPYEQADRQAGLRYYYFEGLAILTGVGFYATHFPESWKPKKYDIWGSSYQIFHICVVLGALFHFCGIFKAFEWNYMNQRCAWS